MAESSSSSSSTAPALRAKSDTEIEEMLDRMLTRLALCDDSNLEPLLSKLLPLTISSLSSQAIAVRNKVLEILSHVNKRVKLQSDIGLPLTELWKLYSEPGAAPMIRNFCIVYIEMAFQRVDGKVKEGLAPELLMNISKLPVQHQEIILRIIVKVIGECHSGQIADEVAAKFKEVNNSQDRELFIEFCLHTMLYQRVSQSGGFPPGLSVTQVNRVTGKQQLQSNELLLRKLGILNVIQAMELDPELVYPLYIAASVDCEEPVVKRGEELLKKKASGANLDDLNLLKRLFLLFNGTVGAESVDSESRVSPGSYALKAKLMSIFCRSIAAANSFPSTLQCIFGCVYGNGTTSRLKQLGMEFTDWVFKHMPEMFLRKTLRCLVGVVNSETSALVAVAMQALGHIGLRISLPPLEDSNSDGILIVLYDKLSKFLLSDDVKAIQKIVISIGHICVKESSSSHIDTTLNLIFSLCRSKAEDVLFAAGEALSFLWGSVSVSADTILRTNFTSLSTASNFLMGDLNSSETKQFPNGQSEHNEEYHASARDAIIKKLFDVLLYSSRKEERCAGTVWLVSLTKYCGSHPIIQKMLPEIQEAFSHLLAEQNELTQELASQGMSIVYDLGDESMKQNLVNALVNTLTGSGKRKRAIKLVEDSEVFQDGSLGETASGGKLNTYKELCSLANEMGQPDLIYKFMDLANHQASLNSKRAAAFGFSKIAKQAGDALKPHLRSLIPRLVRYQYDPDKNVQMGFHNLSLFGQGILLSAIKMLHRRIKVLHHYLLAMEKGDVPCENSLLRQLWSLLRRLPAMLLNFRNFKMIS